MSSINQTLKAKRLESNISIEKIASELNIRKQYIIAIEEEDYTNTPGKVYVEGYIKLYATHLKVDFDSVSFERQKLLNASKSQTINKPYLESSTPSFFYLSLSLIAIFLISYITSLNFKSESQNSNTPLLAKFSPPQDSRQITKSRYDITINFSEAATEKDSLNYFLSNYPFINEREIAKKPEPKSYLNVAANESNTQNDDSKTRNNKENYTEVEVEEEHVEYADEDLDTDD
jgi:cytoskeletal protein RodZ